MLGLYPCLRATQDTKVMPRAPTLHLIKVLFTAFIGFNRYIHNWHRTLNI